MRRFPAMGAAAAALVFALALSACGSLHYEPIRSDPTPLSQAERKCELEVLRSTSAIVNPFDQGLARSRVREACMAVEGYELTFRRS